MFEPPGMTEFRPDRGLGSAIRPRDAALAVRQSEIETATTLLAGATHRADPLDITGYGLYRSCRDETQAAVAVHEANIDVARRRSVDMTLDDLVNYTFDTLATP